MINHFIFFISEAFIGIKRSPVMMVISIITIVVSLFVFATFLLVSVNMNNIVNHMYSKLEIRVFLNSGLTPNELEEFKKTLVGIPAIKAVTYIDKDIALQQLGAQYPYLNLKDFFESNPLPNSFKVILHDNRNISEVVSTLKGYSTYVESVRYGGETAEKIQKFVYMVRLVGFILVGILTFATLIIIVNTIRLTVLNRLQEINIMKLVGATNLFISGPFIVEGLLIGCLGSFISLLLVRFFYSFFLTRVEQYLPFFPIVTQDTSLSLIYGFIFIFGTLLGIIGALISISRALKQTP